MSAIDITEITEGTVAGKGAFDKLMAAITAHLDVQYKAGHIKGAEYASVYLGALQSAAQQSVTFVLGEHQAQLALTQLNDTLITSAKERVELDTRIVLLNAQTQEQLDSTLRANTELDRANLQLEDTLRSSAKQRAEIDTRIVLLDAQIQEQLDSTTRSNSQLNDSLLTSLKQRVQTDSQIDLINVQMAEAVDGTTRANIQVQDGLDTSEKQREQMGHASDLSIKQALEVVAGTTRDDLATTQDNLVKAAQVLKLSADVSVLNKKAITETAQALLVGEQKDLYTAQTTGFARDAEQKAAKLVSEIWQISKGTDPNGYDIPVPVTQIGYILKNTVKAAGIDYDALTP
jgi:hypothetical protein